MKPEKKFDSEFRFDRGQIETLMRGDGFLRARVSIARPGVFPYFTPSGDIRMEAKLPGDLFSDITINSAKGAPVTDGHPPIEDNRGMVSTTNWQKYVKGSLGDTAIIKDNRIDFTETVFDAALIADLEENRKVEVSIGFKTDIDYTPGEFEGQRYDARQTNILINHVAHVDKGRAGESVRAYLDSADVKYAVQTETKNTTRRDSKMESKLLEAIKKFLALLGISNEEPADGEGSSGDKPADGNGGDTGTVVDSKTDSAKELLDLRKKVMVQQAKIDALEAVTKKQDADKKRSDEALRIDEAVKNRLTLIDTAKSVIPDVKYDGLTDRAIKLAVIEKTLPYDKEVKVDTLDDLFIDARFDAALTFAREKANITGDTVSDNRIDEAVIEKKKSARLNMLEV